jgi:hypothetical protein
MENYGRVTPETVTLIRDLAGKVRNEVVSAMPGSPSQKVEAMVLETVLAVVLRDWRENNNVDGLNPTDIVDLRSFIALAQSAAGNDPYGRGLGIFEAALKGLLEDWLENWNAPSHPGPPVRN